MPDLSDPWVAIRELQSEVRRLRSGIQLENSSITNGRMRFIGGTLRIDSGGRVEIVGTLEIDGNTTVSGTFDVDGPWSLDGNGTITGNVTSTGTFTQNGPWALNGTGTIAGNVTQTGNLTVSGGGKINVGTNMTLTPGTDGGSVVFGNGSKLSANASSIGLTYGTSTVRIGDSTAGLLAGSNSITVSGSGVQINLAAIPTESTSGLPSGTLSINGGGFLRRAV